MAAKKKNNTYTIVVMGTDGKSVTVESALKDDKNNAISIVVPSYPNLSGLRKVLESLPQNSVYSLCKLTDKGSYSPLMPDEMEVLVSSVLREAQLEVPTKDSNSSVPIPEIGWKWRYKPKRTDPYHCCGNLDRKIHGCGSHNIKTEETWVWSDSESWVLCPDCGKKYGLTVEKNGLYQKQWTKVMEDFNFYCSTGFGLGCRKLMLPKEEHWEHMIVTSDKLCLKCGFKYGLK